jgi:hypothetical protein
MTQKPAERALFGSRKNFEIFMVRTNGDRPAALLILDVFWRLGLIVAPAAEL